MNSSYESDGTTFESGDQLDLRASQLKSLERARQLTHEAYETQAGVSEQSRLGLAYEAINGGAMLDIDPLARSLTPERPMSPLEVIGLNGNNVVALRNDACQRNLTREDLGLAA